MMTGRVIPETTLYFFYWLLLYLTLPLCNGKTLNWIDTSELDLIYNEIGFKDVQFNPDSREYRDQCTVKVSNFNHLNDASFRVECHTIQNCQISLTPSQKLTDITVLPATSVVAGLWERCAYQNGDKLFRKDNQSLKQLNSTVIQLLHGNTRVTAFPQHYFCGLTNLTILDLSKNNLRDLAKLGLKTGCRVNDNQFKCCGCQLKELNLDSNELETVRDDAFCGLKNLVVLRMSRCRVRQLDAQAFRGLDNLKYLDLTRNNLTKLSDGTFRFNSELRILYLSNNKLNGASLPALKSLKNIRQLYLDRNRIETVDRSVLESLTYLKVLNLRENLVSRLEANQFGKLTSLRILDLSYNKLHEIGKNALLGISNIVSLDISFNMLRAIESGAFRDCFNLTRLQLSSNRLGHVPREINRLRELRHLYMDRNQVVALYLTDLVNLTKLIDFDLSENNLTTMEKGAFDSLKNIITLKLTRNRLTNARGHFTSTYIVNLFLDHNNLTDFSFDDFSPNIKYLSVVSNNIKSFNSSAIDPAKRLDLDMSCNQLTRLDQLQMPLHSKFNFRNNRIQSITYNSSFLTLVENSIVQQSSIYLQNNAFEEICPSFVTSTSSAKVQNDFANNPIKCSCENAWMFKNSFQHSGSSETGITDLSNLRCTPTFSRPGLPAVPMRLKTVGNENFWCKSEPQIADRRCKCDKSRNCYVNCPYGCLCYTTISPDDTYSFTTVLVDCGHSHLQSVPHSVDYSNMSTSSILYMDGNNLGHINASAFVSFTNVHKLYLNSSKITSIDADAFEMLFNLRVLHLEDNELQTLPFGIFSRQMNLEELYLQNNFIEILPTDIFFPLKSLKVIHISNNSLVNYTVWKFDELRSLTSLNLQDNRWSCDCDFIKTFSDFLRNSSIGKRTTMPEKLFCTEANQTVPDQHIVDYYFVKCYSNNAVYVSDISVFTYIWASLLGIFICVTIIALGLFYFRHELQVMYYSRYGIRVFTRSPSRTAAEEGKIYDAFISYSSEDEEFLVHRFLPGLENLDRPYRLCLHQRDFAPGAFITDSILEAVERSSRTIVLLSDNFVKSEWCKFEFKTAHAQMLHDRCARVLMVVMGDIPADVDPEMKLYLKTNTYLKWGEKLFWEKMYFALPEKKGEPKSSMELLPRNSV